MSEISPNPALDLRSIFPGNSETAELARATDWSTTSLGPVAAWPRALRAAVRTAMESPFPINLWCGRDKVLVYNDAYRIVLGAKHPRALGRPGPDVWAEIWQDIEPLFRAAERGERVYAEDAHFVMERSEGPPDDAWFTFSLSPIRDENGEVFAFLNIASETTARVRAEAALRAARSNAELAERRLRDIFSQAPGFLAVLQGPEHRFEFANAAYVRLVGGRAILGHTVAEALPEVTGQGFVDLLDQVYRTGVPYVGSETPVMLENHADGSLEERIVSFVYQPMLDVDGNATGIVVHGSDVTDGVRARREVEQLLASSEQARARVAESELRYRFLANAIPVQVWTARPDGTIDYVSDRTAEYFGVPAEELLGDGYSWRELLHPDDLHRTRERWAQSAATGEPYEIEFRLRRSDTDEYRWHLSRASAQRDEHGAIIRWFGTNTDIEDRRRAEAELERLTREATEANRAKSDFLAAMSHELRTPLNAIGGYAQIIELGLRGPVTDEQRHDLIRIQRSKNHLDALVSDVLNFAKAGSGRIDFRPERLGVAKLLETVLEMITPQAREKSMRLEWPDVDPALAVHADPDRTRQILLNLAANALKFTQAGGTIAVSVTATEREVEIAVRDTGVGIAPEFQEKIFEPFVQAGHRTTSPTERGVGLGLAISRQLARAMGGDLRVRSSVGAGSTFALTLPRIS